MNDNSTTTILQRAPVVLAVTAASYGLPFPGERRALPRSRRTPEGGFGATATRFSCRPPMRRTAG